MSLIIQPVERDLGELVVRRILPHAEKRAVGPFVFFDHMGPAEFPPGAGIQVRPHPHIGLSTVTYLFEGEIMHRDSLGYVQAIQPGAVNLMTAGRGIVHSERAGSDLDTTSQLHGIQIWIGLPEEEEERDPAFEHFPAGEIPRFNIGEVSVGLVMGSAFGRISPVTTYSETVYLDLHIPGGETIELPEPRGELAFYPISGEVDINGATCAAGQMAVFEDCAGMAVSAAEDAHVLVVGGKPLGKRTVWWNFVSSSKERIEQAKADWKAGRFEKVPGETEFIPLPD